jgi:protease-4
MDTPNAETPVPPQAEQGVPPQQPYVPSAEGHAGPPYPPPPIPPKKKLSTGAKWGIGIAVAFVLLTCVSCAISATLLGDITGESSISLGDSIAVIHLEGTIQGGTGLGATPEYILDQLDKALADDNVKAILLRIDSPGGTVAASQEIALAVKRASEKKPVVVSVGDICASGGYMVASQADEIIASPGSSVGSIGVIMEVANVEELLNKVGISFTTLTTGAYKDAGSPYRSLTETETAMLNEQLTVIYDQFITDVAEGRDLPETKVRELATGWVWLGSEALDLGLVDSLGNYNDAVKRTAELGGIKGEPNIVSYEYVDPLSGLWSTLLGAKAEQLDAETLRRIGLPR